jgi:hypothetical protein
MARSRRLLSLCALAVVAVAVCLFLLSREGTPVRRAETSRPPALEPPALVDGSSEQGASVEPDADGSHRKGGELREPSVMGEGDLAGHEEQGTEHRGSIRASTGVVRARSRGHHNA